ncbi:maleylpyruvate isomerase family mycothiol-dependent enzyme [Spirillospora sp. CA-253888]
MREAAKWQVVAAERAGLADLLETLTADQWGHPSLCDGWTVREVAAHLGLGPRMGRRDTLAALARARGSFDRMVRDTALREAARPTAELVALLRAGAGSRHLAPGQKLDHALLDVLVHGQDIAVPLGFRRPVPAEAARHSADVLWRMRFPFHPRRRLRGVRLTATDTAWTAGEGARLAGPIAALLLLLSGRHAAALPELDGPGAAVVAARTPS